MVAVAVVVVVLAVVRMSILLHADDAVIGHVDFVNSPIAVNFFIMVRLANQIRAPLLLLQMVLADPPSRLVARTVAIRLSLPKATLTHSPPLALKYKDHNRASSRPQSQANSN